MRQLILLLVLAALSCNQESDRVEPPAQGTPEVARVPGPPSHWDLDSPLAIHKMPECEMPNVLSEKLNWRRSDIRLTLRISVAADGLAATSRLVEVQPLNDGVAREFADHMMQCFSRAAFAKPPSTPYEFEAHINFVAPRDAEGHLKVRAG